MTQNQKKHIEDLESELRFMKDSNFTSDSAIEKLQQKIESIKVMDDAQFDELVASGKSMARKVQSSID